MLRPPLGRRGEKESCGSHEPIHDQMNCVAAATVQIWHILDRILRHSSACGVRVSSPASPGAEGLTALGRWAMASEAETRGG